MKRLFYVANRITGKMSIPHGNEVTEAYDSSGFFSSKEEAKKYRNELGASNWRVSRGPDHIGKHGQNPVPRMRRQPKNRRKTDV